MGSLRASLAAIVAAYRDKVEQRRSAAAPTPQAVSKPEAQQLPEPQIERSEPPQEPQVIFWLSGARKAIALKQTIHLLLWLALHHLNRQAGGSGILSTGQRGLERIARLVDLSPGRIRVTLKAGDGIWWQRLPGARVRLFGQADVNAKLSELAAQAGISDPCEPDIHCQMPLTTLKAGLVAFQGYIVDAWLAEHGPNGHMATWSVLSGLWGHSRAQIMDWIKEAGIIKQHNKGYHPYPLLSSKDDLDAQQNYLQKYPEDIGFSHSGIWLEEHEGQVYFCFQRGNTYYSRQSSRRTTAAGKARKVNGAIRKCAGDIGDKVIKDALGLPGGFITHPDPDSVGVSAGQRLMNTLDELFAGLSDRGGLTCLLNFWNKLTAQGRIFQKRTNYRDGKAFYKARRKRPDVDLYMFQTSVRLLRTNSRPRTQWWGIWLHTKQSDRKGSA